jgi:hypothetical protein
MTLDYTILNQFTPRRTSGAGLIGSLTQSVDQPKARPRNARPRVGFLVSIAPYEMAARGGRIAAIGETPANGAISPWIRRRWAAPLRKERSKSFIVA